MITPENLYEPTKYKVTLGKGISTGLCTLWNEPDKALAVAPLLFEKSAIIGTLYSRQGVNIILRNLALNPQIQTLYIWTAGTLSCSPFGVSGKDILLKLWSLGITDDGTIPETGFKIEKEIDIAVVRTVIAHVSLVEIPDEDPVAVAQKIVDGSPAPYMSPVSFPPAVPEEIDVFPSELVGFVVRGKTVLETWTKVVDRIMRYGITKGTQYGTQQRELIGVTWVIEKEDITRPNLESDLPESLKKTMGLELSAIEHYKKVFTEKEAPAGVAYTYGSRLMNYPGSTGGIDQIQETLIKQLKDSKDTRRGVATTLVPEVDKDSKEPPCLTQVQVLQTNGKLHLLCVFRSHDIFKAAIPNAFGLLTLQKNIADAVGMDIGFLQITSQSAHIYEAEWSDAKKLVACAIWEREPETIFDPGHSGDRRGMCVVSNKDGKLSVYFKTPTGDDLLTIHGNSANFVRLKLAQLDLLSEPYHLLDIGAELEKAEMALRLGVPYIQDKPLDLTGKQVDNESTNVCIDC